MTLPLLVVVATGILALLALVLWRSARSGTGIWWPLVIAALVLGGLGALGMLSPE